MARKTTECRVALSGEPGLSRVAKKAKKENCRRVGGPSAIPDAAAAESATLTDAVTEAAAGAAPPLSNGAGDAGPAAKATRRPLNGGVAEANAAVSVASASCPVSAEEARQDCPTLSTTISPSSPPVAQPVVSSSPSPTSTRGSCSSPSSSSSFSASCSSASLSASSSAAASSSPSASSTFAACSFFAQEKKKGVLYIARLPPQMNRATLRRYFDRFGALGRLHVAPLVNEGGGGRGSAFSRARRSRHGGGEPAEEREEQQEQRGAGEAQQQRGGGGGGQQLKSKNDAASATPYRPKAFAIEFSNGAEAWLEFLSRKDAKRVARLLDGQPVASWAAGMGPGGRGRARKARRQWGGDIWCLRYLKGFTWQQLIEEKVYNRRVREARLNAALSQIKRENAVYVHLVEQQKQIDKMREKRRAKLLLLQDQQPPTSTTAAEAADSQRDRERAEGQQEKPAAGGSRKAIGKDVLGSSALHTAKVSLLGGNLWGAPSTGAKLAQQQQQQQQKTSTSSRCSSNSGRAASALGAAEQGSAQGQRERKDGERQRVAAAGNKVERPAGPLQTKQTTANAYADLFNLF